MFKKYFLILSIILSFTLSSCSSYYFTFDTFLSNSESQQLKYEDSLFVFEFIPSFDGIYFQITNLTESPAFLLWDNSYIILPDGNSAKALNTDLLNLTSEVLIKVKNESIIPPKSNFARFTTADINVEKNKILFISERSSTINYLNIYSTLTKFDYRTLYSFDYYHYWPITLPEEISLKKYLPVLKEFVQNNNNLALGFSIRRDSSLINYRFGFKFKKINVFEIPSPWLTAPTHKILEASIDDGWQWKEVDE